MDVEESIDRAGKALANQVLMRSSRPDARLGLQSLS
jgi:hypothetical protein